MALINLLFALLQLLVLIVGVVVTAISRSHRGRGAAFGLAGCVLLVISVLWSTLLALYLPSLVVRFALPASSDVVSLLVGAGAVITSAGTLLLILGVTARSPEPRREASVPSPPGYGGYPRHPGGFPPPPAPGQGPAFPR